MAGEAQRFRKPDRYKESSYRTYNFEMPARYDSSVWMTFCQTALWDRAVIAELGDRIPSLRILDVGCATGRLLSSLAASGATGLAGVDLAANIVDVARDKLARRSVAAELRAADVEDSIPWPAESFDAITLTGVLHHFYRADDALREIHRVLRPGGRLLVLDPEFVAPVRWAINLALRIAPHQGDYRFYSRRGAAGLLERAGFHGSGSRRVGLWAYLVVATKPEPIRAAAR
jgi:ubiquinone/menaquinone biosynthesis C-methylase UbiE